MLVKNDTRTTWIQGIKVGGQRLGLSTLLVMLFECAQVVKNGEATAALVNTEIKN